MFRFLDAGIVVLCIGNSGLHLKHVCAGQFLHEFCNNLRVALVDPSDGIVLVSPAEIDNQALAHFLINLQSASRSFVVVPHDFNTSILTQLIYD